MLPLLLNSSEDRKVGIEAVFRMVHKLLKYLSTLLISRARHDHPRSSLSLRQRNRLGLDLDLRSSAIPVRRLDAVADDLLIANISNVEPANHEHGPA